MERWQRRTCFHFELKLFLLMILQNLQKKIGKLALNMVK